MKEPRLSECEVVDGHKMVNGRPHGFNWKRQYKLTCSFDTEEERQKMLDEIRMNPAYR